MLFRSSLYIASDLNDQKKVVYYNNYGPKILTGEKGIYNEALMSRSITFDMEQDYPEVFDLSEVVLECEQLKTKLLNYRFKTSTPNIMGAEISLRARYREIFDCLIRTAQHIGQTAEDIIAHAKELEDATLNEMQGTVQWDVLNILRECMCLGTLDAIEGVKISEILERLQWNDEPRKNGSKLGYILKNLGLTTKKKRDCTWLSFVEPKNNRKLTYLFKRFKVDGRVDS